jgi:tartrate dehydratase beta subunit/fumarate hydratase class I family protein
MARIINVQCTGKDRHVNEIDLDDILGSDVVMYGGPIVTGRDVPARIVRRCDTCDEGKVIVTRDMIEGAL